MDTSQAPISSSSIFSSAKRVRYLRIIACFKILKAVLLIVASASLFLLNSRTAWLDRMTEWASDELLLGHAKVVHFLLSKLQVLLSGGHLHALALLALTYALILLVEGIGVYLQKRWAEVLMVVATGGLIPFEIRHLLHRPTVVAGLVVVANSLIVIYLYLVLRREHAVRARRPVRGEVPVMR